jgi:hypothetical protein
MLCPSPQKLKRYHYLKTVLGFSTKRSSPGPGLRRRERVTGHNEGLASLYYQEDRTIDRDPLYLYTLTIYTLFTPSGCPPSLHNTWDIVSKGCAAQGEGERLDKCGGRNVTPALLRASRDEDDCTAPPDIHISLFFKSNYMLCYSISSTEK